jgi:AMMECR1 domain-containing protein
MQAFRNAEMELEDNLKKKAIEEARNDPRFYEVAKLQTEQDLEELFREIKPY